MAEKNTEKSTSALDIKAPFYAAVGVGYLAFVAVNDIVEKVRETAGSTASEVRDRVSEARDKHLRKKLGQEGDIKELLTKFSPEELRKVAEAYSKIALDIFNHLAERGEEATKRLLKSDEAQDAKKAVADKAEAVADKVDEVRELTSDTLGKVASNTRALGEQASKTTTTSRGAAAKKNDPLAK